MTGTFSADVDDIIKKSKKNMLILVKQSLQDVIHEVQIPVAKGGKMRVDTGFLRASGQASLVGFPSGPGRGELKAPNSYGYDTGPVIATIGQLQLGQTLYFGWTARYAKYRELHDGFLESGLQNWSQIVAKNAREIKKRSKL